MIVAGLTGSIGMGKSTTAAMFADEGAPVFDADAAVHAMYEPGGEAVDAIAKAFPGVVKTGRVDRGALSAAVRDDPDAFRHLEMIVHPLVAARRAAFLKRARANGAPVAVLDIPLLFETGGDQAVDAIVVVSAPAHVQRARVLARPGMTPTAFEAILARQVADSDKRARADWVIDTSRGLDDARAQVRAVLAALTRRAQEQGDDDAADRVRHRDHGPQSQ